VSSSAYDAKTLGFLRATDGVTMNRDRLLSDAKSRALELAKNYSPPTSTTIVLLGTSGVPVLTDALKEDRDAGRLSAHDWAIRSRLIDVLTAAPLADSWKAVTEDEIFALEKSAFVDLFVRPMTQERIQHMLKTRKPLRN
jgi:3-hydroxyacyl-CoA dehydrogenase